MGNSTFIKLDCAIDNTHGLIYVHVPKNASCWVKHHLSQTCSTLYNYYHQGFDATKHIALVVLRDPVERWISAMGQVLVGNRPDYYMHVDNLDWDKITRKIMRNNHMQPQHEFFANIPHDRIVWFRCDDKLTENFSNFLKHYNLTINLLPADQDAGNIFNVTKKIPERIINTHLGLDEFNYLAPPQQEIVDKIKNVLDKNPEYVERIKQLYKEDYQLLNTVPYYDPR
jgi:hypothetical protein